MWNIASRSTFAFILIVDAGSSLIINYNAMLAATFFGRSYPYAKWQIFDINI
jgi:hypothetical protein